MRRTGALGSSLLLVALAVTACGGDDVGEFSVVGSLEQVPAAIGEGRLVVHAGSVRLALDAAGEEVPDGDDADAVRDLTVRLGTMTGPEAIWIPTIDVRSVSGDAWPQRTLGWQPWEVDQFVETRVDEGDRLSVVSGDLALDRLEGLPSVTDDIRTDLEADDGAVDQARAADSLRRDGAPTRIAEDAGRVALGSTTPLVQAWLDGDTDTLADREPLRAVAERLDDVGVYAATLMEVPDGGGDSVTVGIGWSDVSDGSDDAAGLTVVYAVDDPASWVEAVREGWTEGASLVDGSSRSDQVEVVDVTAQDSVLTVSLRLRDGVSPQRWTGDVVDRYDLPLPVD